MGLLDRWLSRRPNAHTATADPPGASQQTVAPAIKTPAPAPSPELFCPHCGTEVCPPPRVRRKCPSCGEGVVPRTLLDGKKALLTPRQAEDLDREKAELAEERLLVKRLDSYGVSKRERHNIEATLQQQWGVVPSRRDVAWAAANQKVVEAATQDDFGRLSGIYWQMALQLYDEGRDHFELSKLSHKYGLLAMQRQQAGFPLPMEIRVLGVCPESRAHDERWYTVEEALEEMPIPRADCSWHTSPARAKRGGPGWCACTYIQQRQED
jgi:hypothetical protein